MIPIADVRVTERHRSDLGDLEGLAASLREIGQLQPIVISSDFQLIAGGRRLAAAKSLGWTEIEAKIATDLTTAADLLRAERDENTCRKAFAPTEEYSLYAALLALEGSPESELSSQTARLAQNQTAPSNHEPAAGRVSPSPRSSLATRDGTRRWRRSARSSALPMTEDAPIASARRHVRL
jgi:ParB family chromosome partitioning protein